MGVNRIGKKQLFTSWQRSIPWRMWQTLFDDFKIEPNNIFHACEFNPFEAYKQIFGAIYRYREAMTELCGCKAFVLPK